METERNSVFLLIVRTPLVPGGRVAKSAITVAGLPDFLPTRLLQEASSNPSVSQTQCWLLQHFLLGPFCSGKLFSSTLSHRSIQFGSGVHQCVHFLETWAGLLSFWFVQFRARSNGVPTRVSHTGQSHQPDQCHLSFTPCLVRPGCPGFCYFDACS